MGSRKRLLAATFALLTMFGSTLVGVEPVAAAGFFEGDVVRAYDAEVEMLDTINRTRAQYGQAPLANKDWGQFEGYLNCIAAENADQGRLEHYPDSCDQGFVEAEILAARFGSGGASTNTLVQQWNESTGHRQIMMAANADFASVGVFCIGNTSWAIAWIGADNGNITSNTAPLQPIDNSFFTDNDYRCRNSATEPVNDPLAAHTPAESLEELVNQPGFDKPEADVLRLYRAFFRRDADIGGANYWLGISANGATIDQISFEFAASQEFQNTYGNVNNRDYLAILYSNILDREPDGEGFNYWLDLMNSGELDRGGVVRWIAANDEFINRHQYGGH